MTNLGVHTYCFAPRRRTELPFVEKATLIASALQWQRYNGPMALVCDAPFYDFIEREGLLELYQDIHELPEIPEEINQEHFWAACKIFSYLTAPPGSFHIDTDAVVNGPIPEAEYDLAVAHYDVLESSIGRFHYQATNLSMPEGYTWPSWLRGPHNDWHGYPKSPQTGTGFVMVGLNTAIFMARNPEFIREYCRASLDFMAKNPCTDDYKNWGLMVWAEQVMLLDLAKERQLKMMEVAKQPGIDWMHLQDLKAVMKKNPEKEREWIYLLSQKVDENSLWHRLIMPGFDTLG